MYSAQDKNFRQNETEKNPELILRGWCVKCLRALVV